MRKDTPKVIFVSKGGKLWYGRYEVISENEVVESQLNQLSKDCINFELPKHLDIRILRKPYTKSLKAYTDFTNQFHQYDEMFYCVGLYRKLNNLPEKDEKDDKER